MKDEKEFVVENRKVGKTFTIKGKSLKDALKIEMLDPEKWLLVADPEISKPPEEA